MPNEISKKALELEKENQAIEDMEDPKKRKKMIAEAHKKNEEIAKLEKQTGLSEAEILSEYEKLTEATAREGIENVLAELSKEIGEEEAEQIRGDLRNKRTGSFLEKARNLLPRTGFQLAAACVLFLTVAACSFEPSSSDEKTTEVNSKDKETEQSDFAVQEYYKLVERFKNEGLTDTEEYAELQARFGPAEYEKKKKEQNLSDEEATKRFESAIQKRADDFIKRAKKSKEIDSIALEMGIDPKGKLDVLEINGKMTINDQEVPENVLKKVRGIEQIKQVEREQETEKEKEEKSVLESENVRTDVY